MIWKLLTAIALNFVFFVGAPKVLEHYHLVPDLKEQAWVVLVVAAATVSLKTICGDIASGEFAYHKHGYDFCVTTLGACMSSLGLQILTPPPKSIFPQLASLPLVRAVTSFAGTPYAQSISYLIFVLFSSLVFTLICARISRAINREKPAYPSLLALINFCLGSAMLGFYVLLLVLKK